MMYGLEPAVWEPEVLGAEEDYGGMYGQDEGELDEHETDLVEVLGAQGYSPEEAELVVGEARRRRGRRAPSRGAARRGMSRRQAQRGMARRGWAQHRAAQRGMVAPHPPISPFIPGAPPVAEKILVLPFTDHTFTVADQTPFTLVAEPQNQIRGARLVTTEIPNAGADTDGARALASDIKIGTRSELVGVGNIPFSIFGPTAFGVGMKLDGAGPGIKISIPVALNTTLATAGAEVYVNATLIGTAIS